MPAPSDEDVHTSAMVSAVRDMARKLEAYTQHSDQERGKLLESVNGTVEAMRKDVHVAIAALQIKAMQHEDSHNIDRHERISRQLILNLVLGALIALGVLNLILNIMR